MKKQIKARNRLIKRQFKRLKLSFELLGASIDEHSKIFIYETGYKIFANSIRRNLEVSFKETLDFTLDFLKLERGVPKKLIPVVRNETLEKLGEKVISEKVTSITNTTKNTINKIITNGQKQGMNTKEIAKEIKEKVKHMSNTRAMRIAKTETSQTATTVYHEGLVQAKLEKTWWHVGGGKTDRESHLACDGETIPADETFSNGLSHPHELGADASEIVNCNCVLV